MKYSHNNLSPLDNRYRDKISDITECFSEYALIKIRFVIEIEWLIFLCTNYPKKFKPLSKASISKLKKFIEIAIDTYVINVIVGDKYDENLSFKITQSWGNLTRPGSEGHHLHKHSNSVISGVFYVQTNDVDNITFANPLLAHDTIRIRTKEYNQFRC